MEYGKFNSAEELLKGYTELEKSFTQKCQELSALKQDIEQNKLNESGTSGQPSPQETPAQSTAVATVPTEQNADSSVQSLSAENVTVPPRVMTGGGNVSMALPNRPKTLKEASELAKKYFN